MTTSNQDRIRIKLESFDSDLLNQACTTIQEKVTSETAKVVGPIRLPSKKRIYCVLRSPHVNKDAREHFEIRVHKRIIDIYPTNSETATSLIGINLPSGINTTVIF